MKKDVLKTKVLLTAAKLVEESNKKYVAERLPHCTQILHQPKRPKTKSE